MHREHTLWQNRLKKRGRVRPPGCGCVCPCEVTREPGKQARETVRVKTGERRREHVPALFQAAT